MDYLAELAPYNLHRWIPRLSAAAFLLIDMQECFLPLAGEILLPVKELVGECRECGVPILYTAPGHDDPQEDGGALREWWEDLIIHGTEGHRIIEALAPKEGERVFHKKRYSAFLGTGLESYLRGLGTEDLILASVMTNLCCETMAREPICETFECFSSLTARPPRVKNCTLPATRILPSGLPPSSPVKSS